MSDPYIGEIRLVGFNFAPVGFLSCDGSLQSIQDNEALFQLIGTTYGGDGISTFGLPNLRSRVVVNQGFLPGGSNYTLGQTLGTESVILNANQLPPHSHSLAASNDNATQAGPGGAYPAVTGDANPFYTTDSAAPVTLNSASVGGGPGSGQSHDNRMPLLALNYIICTDGIYPSQN